MKKYHCTLFLIFLVHLLHAQVIVDLLDCEPDCIWSVDVNSIKSWNYDTTTPTIHNVSVEDGFGNLSIGHVNLNNDTTLNTFISFDWNVNKINYWNGTSWDTFDATISEPVIGMGSFQNHTYLKVSGGIYYFDGINEPVKISEDTGVGADLVVDELGRAWTGDPTGPNLDSLIVLNPLGDKLYTFPLSEPFPTSNLYGMAMVDDTIYIGLGGVNPIYPNKVLTVVIEDDIALLTDVIYDLSSMSLTFVDMASVRSGNPLNTTSSVPKRVEHDIQIFPNPANDFILLEFAGDEDLHFELYNMQGIRQKSGQLMPPQAKINISEIAAGMYILLIHQKGKLIGNEKLVIIQP